MNSRDLPMQLGFVSAVAISLLLAFHFWQKSKDFEILYNDAVKTSEEWQDEYNRAVVAYTEEINNVEFLDAKLQAEIEKPVEKMIERVYVRATSNATGGGLIQPIIYTNYPQEQTAPLEFEYNDERITITVDTKALRLDYKLHQRFKLNMYVWQADDYRFELAEVDSDGRVMHILKIDEFKVTKVRTGKRKFNFGTSLLLGGDALVVASGDVLYQPKIALNFISYGASHLDSDWRFLSIGAGLKAVTVTPVSYRIANELPLVSDIFIDTNIGLSYSGSVVIGLGLSTTF